MKRDRSDETLSAYLDGALRGRERARVEDVLEADPALRRELERGRALGKLVRESWTDAPPTPSVDYLIRALRPEFAAIDRERAARSIWLKLEEKLERGLARLARPAPLAISAAAMLVAALLVFDQSGGLARSGMTASLAPPPADSSFGPEAPELGLSLSPEGIALESAPVYDLSQGETPVMIFQGEDGSTTFWLIQDGRESRALQTAEFWG